MSIPGNLRGHLPGESAVGQAEQSVAEGKSWMETPDKVENAEGKKKPYPILIVYRDNDLFEDRMPMVSEVLSEMGRPVAVQAFLRGTEGQAIEQWYQAHKDQIKDCGVISDYTAKIPKHLEVELELQGVKKLNYAALDQLFSTAIRDILLEGKYLQGQDFFDVVIKRILENPQNKPKNVYIFLDHITDHIMPTNADNDSYRDEQAAEMAGPNRMKVMKILMNGENYQTACKRVVAARYRRELVRAGIDPESITIMEDLLPGFKVTEESEEVIKEVGKSGNWVIIDRHTNNDIKDLRERLKGAKLLELPEGNFFDDAVKEGLLGNLPVDKLKEKIRELLEKAIEHADKN